MRLAGCNAASSLPALVVSALLIFSPQVASGAQTVSVSALDNSFSPQTINITQGDTVRWTNNGTVSHTITADNGSFSSSYLSAGQTFEWTFNTPGTYRYYCTPHGGPGGSGMSGTVIVSAPQSPVTQNVTLTQTPSVQQTTLTTTTSGNAAIEALRAQITQLINQISVLQQQYGAGSAAAIPSAGAPASTAQCPLISRSLKRGSEGDDVARLQRFLALDPSVYPEARVTGYYGPLTEAAIRRFQCKNKLVCEGTPESTGYGVAGPRTAALLALQCPDAAANVGGFLKVGPLSGPAPLAVTVEAIVNVSKSCSAATYDVDYGDGTPRTQLAVPANYCNELRQVLNHTYTQPGTFVITLRSGVFQVSSTVVVGGGVATDTFTASPTTGAAPLSVTFKGIINSSASCSPSSYSLSYGDGAQPATLTPSGCAINGYTLTHAYSTAGSFTARLTRVTGNVEIGSIPITAGLTATSTTQADSLSASPTSGTAPLSVTFSGLINTAAVCDGGSYTLVFGDGGSASLPVSGCYPTSFTVARVYNATGTIVARLQKGSTDVRTVNITVAGGQSAGYGEYFAVTPGVGGSVYAVSAEFEIESPCSAYQLDWGDGSALVSQTQGSCALGTVSRQFNHTYASVGSYTITLKRGATLHTVHTAGITISE